MKFFCWISASFYKNLVVYIRIYDYEIHVHTKILILLYIKLGITNYYYDHDSCERGEYKFGVYDVGGERAERVKWIHQFDQLLIYH